MPPHPTYTVYRVTDGRPDLLVCVFFPPVRHSIPPLLHSLGQHRAGTDRQSLCGSGSEIQLDYYAEAAKKQQIF